jgi:hypothetical protein
VLVAEQYGVQGEVSAAGMLTHVHCEAFDSATERMEGRVALVALNLGADTLAAHAALQIPAVSCDLVNPLNWLHEVCILNAQLWDPLQRADLP